MNILTLHVRTLSFSPLFFLKEIKTFLWAPDSTVDLGTVLATWVNGEVLD